MSIDCNINWLKTTIKHYNDLKEKIIVVKLSHIILENSQLFCAFIEDVKLISACGAKVIIVHDYTNIIKNTASLFGISSDLYLSEISDELSTMVVEMILSGYVNKQIVSKLCAAGVPALGISGRDGNFLVAKKSKKKFVDDKSVMHGGFLSEPLNVTPDILLAYSDMDFAVVISPVTSSVNNKVSILEIDMTTAMIASAVGASKIVMLGNKNILTQDFIQVTEKEELDDIISMNVNHNIEESLLRSAYYTKQYLDNVLHFGDANCKNSLILSIFYGKEY